MVSVKTIHSGTVFAWFMLVVILRRTVMLAVAMSARRGKPFSPGSRPPEDNKLIGKQTTVVTDTYSPVEFIKDVRATKTINNDTENDPYFFILLLATAISDSASQNCTRTIVYSILYLFIRIAYAVTYIMALQPWRSMMFAFGLALTLACSLDLVITMSLQPN
ncbi:unnamed protein product [Adineta steineri]|uniref:Microsomal glutathione S-transferase 1 n=1 Tax=Adineta steineri TaxID=433720 RepID=A0A813RKY1_9BILA|nr:unnamed protein product [Adineta steineri]CAF4044977.1 unnamed protein product [Adineta steineri]